jgi:hypothetical protein
LLVDEERCDGKNIIRINFINMYLLEYENWD